MESRSHVQLPPFPRGIQRARSAHQTEHGRVPVSADGGTESAPPGTSDRDGALSHDTTGERPDARKRHNPYRQRRLSGDPADGRGGGSPAPDQTASAVADTRQWPGFRVREPEHWNRGTGRGTGITAAAADLTFPQAVIHRSKKQDRQAGEALIKNAAGDSLTGRQASLRRALASGKLSTLDPTQHIVAETIRFLPGGRNEFLALVQRAYRNHDADAKAWWETFMDLLPADQKHVDLDLICEASGVAPDRLMAIVVSTAMRAGADAAELVAATSYPRLIRQTNRSAMRIGGQYASIAQKDREFMLQHHKFIAAPKGGSVFVTANANANAAAAAQSQPSVPTFSESLDGAMNAHKAIQGELVNAGDIEDP